MTTPRHVSGSVHVLIWLFYHRGHVLIRVLFDNGHELKWRWSHQIRCRVPLSHNTELDCAAQPLRHEAGELPIVGCKSDSPVQLDAEVPHEIHKLMPHCCRDPACECSMDL